MQRLTNSHRNTAIGMLHTGSARTVCTTAAGPQDHMTSCVAGTSVSWIGQSCLQTETRLNSFGMISDDVCGVTNQRPKLLGPAFVRVLVTSLTVIRIWTMSRKCSLMTVLSHIIAYFLLNLFLIKLICHVDGSVIICW